MNDSNLNWKEVRQNKLTDYISFSYIISLLLMGLMFVKFVFNFQFALTSYITLMSFMFMLFIYFVSRYLNSKTIMDTPTKKTYFLFVIFITLISLAIYNNMIFNRHFLKVYYIIPIILATVNYGQSFGFFVAGYSTINLLLLNYSLRDFSNLDFDIILIILSFWIAWLIGGFIGLERRIQKHLEKMAITDSLTGLPNYANFQRRLDVWLQKAEKKQVALSLVIMDLDNFKFFNDSLGHQKGDELLKNVAILVKEEIEEEDIFFARCGGDEFVFLFFGYDEKDTLSKITKIKDKVQENLDIPYEEFLEQKPTFSLGISSFPEQAKNKKELIDMADYALYQVKTTQKDQVKVYYEALNELAAESEESERKLFNSVRTLLNIINAKDKYTYGHSDRVAGYVREFAEELGLSTTEKKKLIYGAFFHDIGKIEIEREILMKPERLTEVEWQKIKRHPEIGAEILKPLESCQEILPMSLYHHENYDGTGYPKGLKENEIPFYARILRIVDSFDAMTSKRQYSFALSKQEALEELNRGAGKEFDPILVKIFTRVAEKNISLN
ncbi:hypothetical protein U472_02560 [Orenia metallireducens]|uniref:Diguanylate cyclase n=1 Tax=Orenia metallireducens TaxID=1413210 RepID=A0A1C0ACJ9_9FIRM|nr:HD domain-containing phosphohydrolase [Orenia metallireducens]OCL28095.1 hypothetical protein U472_02560 [Orenia metallireducens]